MQSARFKSGDIGVWAALASAFLFGMGTPLAKWLLDQMSPWMLAGLLYLGLGLGSGVYRLLCGFVSPRLNASEMRWLAAAVVCSGGIAPVLLMFGLSSMPSSQAALLINAEAVLTTLLAWAVFKKTWANGLRWACRLSLPGRCF